MPEPTTRYDRSVLILHPRAPRALLLPSGDAWALPCVAGDNPDLAEVGPLDAAVRERWGIDAVVLRCAYADCAVTPEPWVDTVFVMAPRDDRPTLPPGARWVDPVALADLRLAHPAHGPVIATCLAELETGAIPPQRMPWARRGWFAQAEHWIAEGLAEAGRAPATHVAEVKNWSSSCVLRAETADGPVFFKALPPLLAQTPALTQDLAHSYPDLVRPPLACRMDPPWMLSPDFGGTPLGETDFQHWEETVRRLARIQIGCAGHVDHLLALGCPDQRLARIRAAIRPLLDDGPALERLSADEIARLRGAAPRWEAICDELATYHIPPTLVHSDLHVANVLVRGDGTILFDWALASITHPFFDLEPLFVTGAAQLDAVPDGVRRLRAVYLAAWTDYESRERLDAAFALAARIGALYLAILFQRLIGGLERGARWELAGSVAFWLHRLLDLDAGRAAEVQ